MQNLPLQAAYVDRLKNYFSSLASSSEKSYSDYWKYHARQIDIRFGDNSVNVAGKSGYYIPKAPDAYLYRTVRWARRVYKRSILELDRLARLSTPHSPHTLVPCDLAYDLIFERANYADYEENPGRLDPRTLIPPFRTSRQLRRQWFLRHQYYPNEHVYLAHYVYTLFKRFVDPRAERFLEIGAGNGNLVSLFHHYDGMRGIIVDLPETILLSSSFLKSVFPAAEIVLPHEASQETFVDLKADFVFLTPDQINLLPDNLVDFAVNIHSLQEMTHAQIEDYFGLVQRVVKPRGIWGNLNRVEKVLSRTDLPIRAFEFPYRKQNRVLVSEIDRFIRLICPDSSLLRMEEVMK